MNILIQEMKTSQQHSFQIFLPEKLRSHTEEDLKLIKVSLMNTLNAIHIYLVHLEEEMHLRGIESPRVNPPLSEDEIKQFLNADEEMKFDQHAINFLKISRKSYNNS